MRQIFRLDLKTALKMKIVLGAGFALSSVSYGQTQKQGDHLSDLRITSGEESANDVKSLKAELLVSASEKRALAEIQKLLKKHRNKPIEPELWFRLAELHMKQARTARFFEIHRESDSLVSLLPREVKNSSSRTALELGVRTYDSIEKRFPGFNQMDLVLFNSAFARQSLGQKAGPERIYQSLIKNYPKSDLVADSYLAIGEMNFERKKFALALENFEAASRYSNSRVYPYALYKAAWAHFNLHQNELALKKLEEVVAFGKKVVEEGLDVRLNLRREAVADMATFFEDVHPASEAFGYFRKQAQEEDLEPTLLKLAKLYERHARYKDKETLLLDTLKLGSRLKMQSEIQNELVLNYEHMKNQKAAVGELAKFSKLCAEQPSQVECRELLEETSLKLAIKWLKTWKTNSGYPEFAESAEKAFEIYLAGDRASASEENHNARFAYAELLFQRKKYRQASAQYSLVVGVAQPKSPMAHDAEYGAILALEKAAGETLTPEDEAKFLGLVKGYVTSYPKSAFRLDLEFKTALLAYHHKDLVGSGRIFYRLGLEFSDQEKGIKSQDYYLDILHQQKKFNEITVFVAALVKVAKDATRIAKLNKIKTESSFLMIQTQEEAGDLLAARQEYESFAEEHKSTLLGEKALWNAGVLGLQQGAIEIGASLMKKFAERYPQSPLRKEAVIKAAQGFEMLAQPGRAGEMMQNLGQGADPERWQWSLIAARLFAVDGQSERAVKIFREVRDNAPRLAVEATRGLASLSEGRNFDLADEIIRSGVQPFAGESQLRKVEGLFASGDDERAFLEAKKILNLGSQTSKHTLAMARVIQARILEKEFIAQSVKARADRLATVLSLKTEKLEKTQQAYQSAIGYGDPEVSVEALERLSSLYNHYVAALRRLAPPPQLSPKEMEQLTNELEQLAIPLEEKGVESLSQALALAVKAEMRTGVIQRLRQGLEKLNHRKSNLLSVHPGEPPLSLPEPNGFGV